MTVDQTAVQDAKAEAQPKAAQPHQGERTISLVGPLVMWIGFLALGLILQWAGRAIPSGSLSALSGAMEGISGYIISFPGILVFPFIVSIWIVERISKSSTSTSRAFLTSMINAAYVSLIYAISVFIIMLIVSAGAVGSVLSPSGLSEIGFVIGIPVAILFAFMTVFSLLAFARRVR